MTTPTFKRVCVRACARECSFPVYRIVLTLHAANGQSIVQELWDDVCRVADRFVPSITVESPGMVAPGPNPHLSAVTPAFLSDHVFPIKFVNFFPCCLLYSWSLVCDILSVEKQRIGEETVSVQRDVLVTSCHVGQRTSRGSEAHE